MSGPHKVAVILLNFQNDTSQPWTQDQVRGVVFTNANSVNSYFQEQSGGNVSLTGKLRADGDVFGWYTIANNNAPCNFSTWSSAANSAAAAAGDDLSGYDNYIYIFPHTSACGWAGLAYLPGTYSYINGYPNLPTIAHELGHNFGVHHASALNCTNASGTRVSISSTCTSSEYGDPFDVMGSAATRHVSAWRKQQLGFLPLSATQTVTSDGSYTLQPSEQAIGGVQVLRIPKPTSNATPVYYYLEFKQPFGSYFDNFNPGDPAVNGVTIRIAPSPSVITQSLLVDATPSTFTFTDAPLPVGSTFYDPDNRISVMTTSTSALGATVDVAFNTANSPSESPKPASPKPAPSRPGSSPQEPSGPRLRVSVPPRQKALSTRKLVLVAGCSVKCTIQASGRLLGVGSGAATSLLPVRRHVEAGENPKLALTVPPETISAARRLRAQGRGALVVLEVTAGYEAGGRTVRHSRIQLR